MLRLVTNTYLVASALCVYQVCILRLLNTNFENMQAEMLNYLPNSIWNKENISFRLHFNLSKVLD